VTADRSPAAGHDVAIVGAGAVGLLLAVLLAQRGLDVTVLERREAPSGRSRAIGIHPPGLSALDAAGIGEAVRAEASLIRYGVVLHEGKGLGGIDFADAPIRTLPQHRTETLLESRLAELAPTALRRGVEVLAVRDRGDRVELTLLDHEEPVARSVDGGAPPSTFGVPRTRTARLAVGADGVRSMVRGEIDATWIPYRGTGDYVMADEPASAQPPETAILHLEREGVVESFPLPGGARRWVARIPKARAVDAEAFSRLIDRRLSLHLDPERLSPPSTFTARQHFAAPLARGRIALVGDAAHEVSPIGGQGMNLGWLDAIALDAAIADALETGRSGPALERYARARAIAAKRAMRRAAFNMAMGAPLAGARLKARNAFASSLASPAMRGTLTAAFTMRGL